MEVILIKDIPKVGKEGDVVRVKDGYARNFLIPKKLAMLRTDGAVKTLEAKRKKAEKEEKKAKKASLEIAEKIAKLSVTIPMESGIDDALFGSVTSDKIFHALQQEGFKIDKKAITIEEPIKKLGIYNVIIKLHPEVKENLRVWVVKK